MSSPEFKSLPNSSFSFSKQHTQSPSPSPKTIISLVNPQNQSLPPFSLIHLIVFKNMIEWMAFPYSSSITHHTPSFLSLSWWVNHLKCFDVVCDELGGCDDVFDERWEWKGKGGDCYEGWCWWNERHMCYCWETWLMWWCDVNVRWRDKGVWGWWCVVEWDECLHHHDCVFVTSEQKKIIVQSWIKHILAYLIKWRSWMWFLN